jgi:hypothetical protein
MASSPTDRPRLSGTAPRPDPRLWAWWAIAVGIGALWTWGSQGSWSWLVVAAGAAVAAWRWPHWRHALGPWAWLVLATGLTSLIWVGLCIHRAMAPDVVYVDEGTFHYLGWLWASGAALPYKDAIENKPPGIFILFGLVEQAYGTPYPYVRFAAIGCIVGGALLLLTVVGRLVRPAPALLAASLYLLAATNQTTSPYAAMTTPFMVFFTLAALVATVHCRGRFAPAVLAGVCCALAISFKQAALFEGALFGVCCATGWPFEPAESRRFRPLPAVGWVVGWLAVQGATGYVLATHGILADYIQNGWLGCAAPGTSAPTAAGKRDHLMRTLAWFATYVTPILAGPIAVAGAIRRPSLSDRALVWFGVAWVMVASPMAIGGWSWAHRFVQLFPALAFLTALALQMLWEAATAPGTREGAEGTAPAATAVTAQVWVVVGLSVLIGAQRWEHFTETKPTFDWLRCVQVIDERTTPQDRIYVMPWWDQVYAASHRVGVTRYINRSFLGKPGALDEVRHVLETTPPRMVVLAALKPQPYTMEYFGADMGFEVQTYYDWLEDYVATQYNLIERTSAWRLYERKSPEDLARQADLEAADGPAREPDSPNPP